MKKLCIAFISIASVMVSGVSPASNTISAQSRCALTEATSPTIRGLKLGMTTQQLLAVFPGITKRIEMKDAIDKAKSVGRVEAVQLAFDPAADGDAKQFVGVESVAATVAGGRVVEFGLQYGGATWRTVDEWIAKLSETLKLSDSRDWVTGSNENPNKVLRCDGVEIEAAIQGGGASIKVTNSGYFKAYSDQGKAAEEKKRRDVKP
jgi:hypothetical protein